MKKLMLVTLLLNFFAASCFAQVSAVAAGSLLSTSAVYGMAFTSPDLSEDCSGRKPVLCAAERGLLTSVSFAALAISAAGFKKEELALIKNDSIVFVAGLEKSDSLVEALEELRALEPKLNDLSDYDLALLLALGLR